MRTQEKLAAENEIERARALVRAYDEAQRLFVVNAHLNAAIKLIGFCYCRRVLSKDRKCEFYSKVIGVNDDANLKMLQFEVYNGSFVSITAGTVWTDISRHGGEKIEAAEFDERFNLAIEFMNTANTEV